MHFLLDDFPSDQEKAPLDEQEINELPIMAFEARGQQSQENLTCAICQEEFKVGDSLRLMPCLHRYL
jgi:hypothetical protein